MIKLEDRLNYLLQPPLEALLADRELAMPFRPFPFQFEGVAFLYPRHAAILADEMGLGKTMQAITAIRLLLRRGEVRSVLLVCPKPLVTNWQRRVPALGAGGAGAGDRRRSGPARLAMAVARRAACESPTTKSSSATARFSTAKVLISLREMTRVGRTQRFGDAAVRSLRPGRPRRIAADQEPRQHHQQVVRGLARRRSWALTGTPVENSAEDLVGIFEFLAPGFLSPEMKPRKMGRAASDYVLRRTKDKVLTELPPKMFRDAELELSPEQRETYRLAEEEGVVRLTEMGDSATIQHVFELVLRLKQICNFDPATGASAKLERLEADLEEVAASGRKAIVFSQWVGTIERARQLAAAVRPAANITARFANSPAATPSIRRFRDDPSAHVLLMSYGAGAVGLNLQFASYVFLFDRWWNPAVEDQAINRAHRIGAAGPDDRHAVSGSRHDRGADRPGAAREAGVVRRRFSPARKCPASSA